jgi:hypothetical protein
MRAVLEDKDHAFIRAFHTDLGDVVPGSAFPEIRQTISAY